MDIEYGKKGESAATYQDTLVGAIAEIDKQKEAIPEQFDRLTGYGIVFGQRLALMQRAREAGGFFLPDGQFIGGLNTWQICVLSHTPTALLTAIPETDLAKKVFEKELEDRLISPIDAEGRVVSAIHSLKPLLLQKDWDIGVMSPAAPGPEDQHYIPREERFYLRKINEQLTDGARALMIALGYEVPSVVLSPSSELLAIARPPLLAMAAFSPEEKPDVANYFYQSDALALYEAKRLVIVAGQKIALSPTEARLLAYLVANRNIVVSDDSCLAFVWGENNESFESVKQYISYLRRRLGEDGKNPKFIKTYRGAGYMFEDNTPPHRVIETGRLVKRTGR